MSVYVGFAQYTFLGLRIDGQLFSPVSAFLGYLLWFLIMFFSFLFPYSLILESVENNVEAVFWVNRALI